MTERPKDEETRRLLRLLTDPRGEKGDLSPAEARELRRRLEVEPDLASRFERLRAPWQALGSPPDGPAPGFTERVMARVTEGAKGPASLLVAPVWARALAALALVAGSALGPLLVGRLSGPAAVSAPVEIAETLEAEWLEYSPSLAESYFSVLETETGDPEPYEPTEPGGRP